MARSGTEHYAAIPSKSRNSATTKRSARASTVRGEAGTSVLHCTWRAVTPGTVLYRAVLSSMLCTIPSKSSLASELRPQPKARTGQYGTRRCGDTGTARYRTVLCGTVARAKTAVPDSKQQYARLYCGIICAGRAPAFLDLPDLFRSKVEKP